MRSVFLSFLLIGFFFSPLAQADVLPEPESTEPADEDTASEEEAEEKTGCNSIGQLGVSVSLFPILCLGWLAFARNREEE